MKHATVLVVSLAALLLAPAMARSGQFDRADRWGERAEARREWRQTLAAARRERRRAQAEVRRAFRGFESGRFAFR